MKITHTLSSIVLIFLITFPVFAHSAEPEEWTPFHLAAFNRFQILGGCKNVYGLDLSFFSRCRANRIIGVQIGDFSKFNYIRGLQFDGIGNTDELQGIQLGDIGNWCGRLNGLQIGGLGNFAGEVKGVQLSIFNYAIRVKGVQLGAVNYCQKLTGIQLGAFNIISEGKIMFSPAINAGFSF